MEAKKWLHKTVLPKGEYRFYLTKKEKINAKRHPHIRIKNIISDSKLQDVKKIGNMK